MNLQTMNPGQAFEYLTQDIEDLHAKPWLVPALQSHLRRLAGISRHDARAFVAARMAALCLEHAS